jgi:DNA-directed RNA polymerase subunit H (RpoH/RPB5)
MNSSHSWVKEKKVIPTNENEKIILETKVQPSQGSIYTKTLILETKFKLQQHILKP